MKSLLFTSMLLLGLIAQADTYIIEVQFSSDSNDVVSTLVSANDQGQKDFDATLNVDGKEIGLGTQLVVSKCIPKENNKIDLEFSATKRFISQWEKLPDGRNIPYFKARSLKDTKLSLISGNWISLGKLPDQEEMRIRIIKK